MTENQPRREPAPPARRSSCERPLPPQAPPPPRVPHDHSGDERIFWIVD